uniref:Uncharacterized protein n=1 Tax=Anguilla anguilla TaxID=7936 RepID=A0A0E9Q3E4_ANGAN
MIGGTQCQVPP